MTKIVQRAGELAARYGGDEFVVLLPETNEQEALEVARRLEHLIWSLELPHIDTPHGISTISIGIASLVPSKHDTSENLVRQADRSLYLAKKARA